MQTNRFKKFLLTFKSENGGPYLEESVLWYALEMSVTYYLSLSIHERINFKQSYYQYNSDYPY